MSASGSGAVLAPASGPVVAAQPMGASTMGSVAAWAASDTPRSSQTAMGIRLPLAFLSHPVSGLPQAISPRVAALESSNPGSRTRAGSPRRRSAAAQPSAAAALPARPLSRAERTTAAIAAARKTEAEAPEKVV